MPVKEYEQKWFRIPDELTPTIDEVLLAAERGQLGPGNEAQRTVVERLALRNRSVQVYAVEGGHRAVEVTPPVYKNNHTDTPFYLYRAQENYRGEFFVPEGLREFAPGDADLMDLLFDGPGRPAPAIHDGPIPTYIPPDFDPAVHFVSPHPVYTWEEEIQRANTAGTATPVTPGQG